MTSTQDASQLRATGARLQPQFGSGRKTADRNMPTRILVGLFLVAVACLVIWAGGLVFAGFVGVAALAAVREWYRLVEGPEFGWGWLLAGAGVFAAVLLAAIVRTPWPPLLILAATVILTAGLGAIRGLSPVNCGFGPLYIGVPAFCLVVLRSNGAGAGWLVLGLMLVVWSADTGALLVGRLVGGPKLTPLSPNKTWSGLVGGLILPALVAVGYAAAFGGDWAKALGLGIVLAAAAHLGDLFESWVKRRMGCKDSGGLIPGHGGVLDRLDSTLFAAPVAAALVFAFGTRVLLGVGP